MTQVIRELEGLCGLNTRWLGSEVTDSISAKVLTDFLGLSKPYQFSEQGLPQNVITE